MNNVKSSMTLQIKVIAQAKKNAIKDEGGILKVYLTAPAIEGKANKALIALLADKYNVSKGQIEIIKGLHSRRKVVNIGKI